MVKSENKRHFGLIMSDQNKKTRITSFYVLEMLYTGRITKEAISLLLSPNI